VADSDRLVDPAWPRILMVTGLWSGVGFLTATVLFLLDQLDAFGSVPDFHPSDTDPDQALADWFASFFNHQHHLAWDIGLRDTIGPLAWIGLMVLALATLLLAERRALALLVTVLVTAGAGLAAVADLTYLSSLYWWRSGGWTGEIPTGMIATARSAEALDAVSVYLQYVGFVVVAAGLTALAQLREWTPGFRALARVEALGLVLFVAFDWWHWDTLFQADALLVGVLLAPVLAVWWSRQLVRTLP